MRRSPRCETCDELIEGEPGSSRCPNTCGDCDAHMVVEARWMGAWVCPNGCDTICGECDVMMADCECKAA